MSSRSPDLEKARRGGFVVPNTKLLRFAQPSGQPGGRYVDSGYKIDENLLADPTALSFGYIMGAPDGRRPNTYLSVKARLTGNIMGDFALRLRDLEFSNDADYQHFLYKYQSTTAYRLPTTLAEWKKKY